MIDFKILKYNTNRKFRIVSITNEDFFKQNIDINRILINSIKFENMPIDINIMNYFYDFNYMTINFLIEHETFQIIPMGTIPEIYNSKIIDYVKLIKLPKIF